MIMCFTLLINFEQLRKQETKKDESCVDIVDDKRSRTDLVAVSPLFAIACAGLTGKKDLSRDCRGIAIG